MTDTSDKDSRINFLEDTVRRLLRERADWERRAYISENKLKSVKMSSDSKSDDGNDATFLKNFGELIRPIIHDIKSPLVSIETRILHIINLIRAANSINNNTVKAEEILLACQDDIKYLQKLTANLNILGGKKPDIFSLLDVNKLIESTGKLLQKRYADTTIEINLANELPAIQADPTAIEQLISNLVINAIEATRLGSAKNDKRISVSTRISNGHNAIQIIVEDHGIGIQPSAIKMIYNLHYSTKTAGFGVGLFIVKQTVDLHKGDIECDSIPGKGTIFTVTLPVQREG